MERVDREVQRQEEGSIDDRIKAWRLYSNTTLLYSKYKEKSELLADWSGYGALHLDLQRQSDWMSLELFGVDNPTRYNKMLDEFLEKESNIQVVTYHPRRSLSESLDQNKNVFNVEDALREYASRIDPVWAAKTCLKIQETADSNIVTRIVSEKAEQDLKDRIDLDNIMALSITPYYSPSEMEHLGISTIELPGSYSDSPDNSTVGLITTKQWFQEYKNKFNGFGIDNPVELSTWVETVKKLYSNFKDIKEAGDIRAINNRKQSILNLGWNPEIEFNESNRIFASNRINSILEEKYSNYRIINVEESVELEAAVATTNLDYIKAFSKSTLRPIYIVFFNSNSFFNKLVRKIDKSVYSHVSISFDPSLKTMYSFDVMRGGFSAETLPDYIKGGEVKAIQVFCAFVDISKFNILQSKIKEFDRNKKKLGYSFLNLLTIPLKINYIDQTRMVCSQFVDNMLKLADLDFTRISSNMVSPGAINKAIKKYKGDIYKIYTGSPTKYNSDKVVSFILKLATSKFKTESLVIKPFVSISSIVEAKEFPIQFTDDGDLLISKGSSLDFEGEYSRCHMALVEYDKAHNMEAMKYCLVKLWYLNIMLEERIHDIKSTHSKDDSGNLKIYHNARAKIVNDIKTYLPKIQKLDKNFDILKEYNDSLFNDKDIKIRRSTLLYTIDLFKRLIGIKR